MAIIVNLDVMMAKRKMSLNELADRMNISLANLSILKNAHSKAVKIVTMDKLCRILECQPGDLFEFRDIPLPPEQDWDFES